ncbi:MAG: PAS domain S-box protein [Deltaproteobacteria bacterium]|nr:PAS domain S-box protein [Deltaproteobacteria bacterium]
MTLANIFTKYREEIIQQWAHRLHTEVSQHYRKRPLEELFITTSEAADANFAVLVHNDFSKIDAFIKKITRMRLEAGFPLSDVQRAFELYRTIVLPILVRELKGPPLLHTLQKVNVCLTYTIYKFSDYFQSLQEKEIRDYAQDLEREVEKRTKELAESEAKYRVLVEEINDGYFVNQQGKIVFANRTYCEMHGYTLPEVIGRPYKDFVAPESLAKVKRIYEDRIAKGESPDLYIYLRLLKDGRSLYTENKVKLVLYQGKRAAAGICRDITERMEMERRVRESERLAHIGQLTTSLAHEIRNPLSSVKMNIQVLVKKLHLDGNDKRRMEIIAQEIPRLERILEQMLDFAKPLGLDLQNVSINDVVDSSLEVMEEKIKEKGISVKRRLSKKISPVLMDSEKMEQALINVLLNSIESLHDQGKIEIVTREEKKNGRMITVEICDNGPGVQQKDLPYIFDPFFSKKKRGTGIGLTNVKKIVEAHGGMVNASLKNPKGMSFFLMIPSRR